MYAADDPGSLFRSFFQESNFEDSQCTELRPGGKTFSLYHDPNNVGLILVERLLFFLNSDYHLKINFLLYGVYFLDDQAILLRDRDKMFICVSVSL